LKKSPPLPDEEERLKTLESYQLLDTPAETCFDEITELAAKICGTPIALISLVDRDRQWFKSKQGLQTCQTDRDISFCGHAIEGDEIFVVENALEDERFKDNPLVTGDLHLRFYAGMPLISPLGYKIGTLCVIDSEPKTLDEVQIRSLHLLAKNVIQTCELRLQNKKSNQSHQLLNELQSVAQVGAWELDLETSETRWTREIYKIYEIPESTPTSVAQDLASYPEPGQSQLVAMIEKCATQGEPFDGVFKFISSTGKMKWLRNVGRLFTDADGRPLQIVGTCQDVTQQIEREDEFRIQRQFLSDTINNAPSTFYSRTLNGDILMVNDSFREIFGISSPHITGHACEDVFTQENSQLFVNYDKQVIETGEVLETEDEVMIADGSKRIYNSYRFPYRNADGDIYATGCISLDITHKKMLESQSMHKAKLATIGEMAAGAGHEINNPLAIIIGYINKLKSQHHKGQLDDELLLHTLDRIHNSAFRISKIVSSIRSFSRYDTQEKTDFDIIETVDEAVQMAQEIYEGEGVSVAFLNDLSKNSLYVEGNRGQIQQIMINLISNARDATLQEVQPQIDITCELYNENILIRVSDNGSGIPKEIQDRIFDPFFTTKDTDQGTGIGLSLVSKLVSEHHGHLSLESEMGRGSIFTIQFPVRKICETPPLHIEEVSFAELSDGRPQRLLIIDDEEEIRELLKENLVLLGYDVTTAENGEEGLKACETHDFDLVMCDIRMPKMDGYQFFNALKSLKKAHSPHFVFITGGVNVDLALPLSKIEDHVDGFLYKPFEYKQMVELLSDIFDKKAFKAA
jgi:PAS domain S-box-containing protein